VKVTLHGIRLVHTVVFWVLSLCVVHALYGGVTGRITAGTWIAIALLAVESVVLAASGWTCPLTLLAERRGAVRGAVADLFLPRWLADRIFPVCGSAYALALVLVLWRVFGP
jgi:hypothetical protein